MELMDELSKEVETEKMKVSPPPPPPLPGSDEGLESLDLNQTCVPIMRN